MSSATFTPGTVIGGAYRIVRPLAQGGMGAVYVGEVLATGRPCAVKTMHARLMDDPKNRARFAQEAAVGEHIGTDHVVDVYGRGIDEATGMPFIAMELLEGETLQARIWRGGRPNVMPTDEALAALDQLATVLEAAHARALVHRDLKPENIYLTPRARPDAPFTLKLLDFGVARFVDPWRPVLNATAAIGTPLWMAPEQHTGSEISPAADVWAVGLIAFQLLTGRFYWLAANQKELNIPLLLQELLNDPLPSASQRAATLGCVERIPASFDPWFARCVARDPHERFPNASAMRAQLRAAMSGPMLAAPPPPPPPARPSAPPAAPTVAFGDPSTSAHPEAPTSVHVATPFEAPTSLYVPPPPTAVAPTRAARRLAPTLIVAVTAALLGALALSYRQPGALRRWLHPARVVPRRGHGGADLSGPGASPPPSAPEPSMRAGVFLEGEHRTWRGSVVEADAAVTPFDLDLTRHHDSVRGTMLWTRDDGTTEREPAEGTWNDEKGEVSLRILGDRLRRLVARMDRSGGLRGELLRGRGEAPAALSAALKSPLVAAPPP
ncbi:MAG: serine/threonine-protein kinase [Polyangiales bacterium]